MHDHQSSGSIGAAIAGSGRPGKACERADRPRAEMQRVIAICTLACLAALLGLTTPRAVGAAFIRLGDIKGEVEDGAHSGWVEVLSWDWEGARPATVSTNGTRSQGARAGLSDLSFTKRVDSASPLIFLRCADGLQLPRVRMELTSLAHSNRYFEIRLTDVIVTGFGVTSAGTIHTATEEVSLNYTKIEWTYIDYVSGVPAGEAYAWWDLRRNTGGSGAPVSGLLLRIVRFRRTSPTLAELSWSSAPGESYRIYAARDPRGPYSPFGVVPSSGTGASTSIEVLLRSEGLFFDVTRVN